MRCRLEDNPYSDQYFQIEFATIEELENLRDSLTAMLNYMKLCKADGEELPELTYKMLKPQKQSKSNKKIK